MTLTRTTFLTGALAAALPRSAAAAEPATLRVISFGSPALLSLHAAIANGFYARENLTVLLTTTPGSVYQFQHFSAGDYDLALTAFDNLVAYDEGQGEAPLAAPADFVAILGVDNGFLSLYARPDVPSIEALRGTTLGVDAVTTGYAFVLRAVLAAHGLGAGDYAFKPLGGTPARLQAVTEGSVSAALMSLPYDLTADARGLRRLGDVYAAIGPYLAEVAMVRRTWLRDNAAVARAFVRGTRAGLAWMFDPANRAAAIALLADRASLAPDGAAKVFAELVAPKTGMSPTGAIDLAGVRTVLALRSTYGVPPKTLTDPTRYLDPSAL